MIKAQVVADSKNEFGNRITTMVVTMPRIILAEFNTHRMLSRNSASSRAIPFEKMVKSVEQNPFIPIAFQKDHKGMQGTEYFTDESEIKREIEYWLEDRDHAVLSAKRRSGRGVTKQLVNRGLELFMYHTVIVTATEWENFFALRGPQYETKFGIFRSIKDAREAEADITDRNPNIGELETPSKDDVLGCLSINKGQAEIHMMALAEAMWDAYNESTPKELQSGEWHIPFGDRHTANEIAYGPLVGIKIATARCARVSYTVVGEEGKPDNYDNDIKLHDRLAESGHWSPFEHCAQAMNEDDTIQNAHYEGEHAKYYEGFSGNFRGFIQYRKTFKNENVCQNKI